MAKNPIRACARILYTFRSKHSFVVADGGRGHENFGECKRSPTILHRNFISHFGRKTCNALKTVLMRLVYFSLPTETQLLELECFPSEFSVVSSSTHCHLKVVRL